jgi:hypothetical protein
MRSAAVGDGAVVKICTPRSVVVVSSDAQRANLLNALLTDENDFAIIYVESFAGAYARVRDVRPALVIALLDSDDDADGCQMLSMLKIDRDTRDTPIETCVNWHDRFEFEPAVGYVARVTASQAVGLQMN